MTLRSCLSWACHLRGPLARYFEFFTPSLQLQGLIRLLYVFFSGPIEYGSPFCLVFSCFLDFLTQVVLASILQTSPPQPVTQVDPPPRKFSTGHLRRTNVLPTRGQPPTFFVLNPLVDSPPLTCALSKLVTHSQLPSIPPQEVRHHSVAGVLKLLFQVCRQRHPEVMSLPFLSGFGGPFRLFLHSFRGFTTICPPPPFSNF